MTKVLALLMGASVAMAGLVSENSQDASERLRQIELERLRALVEADLDVAWRLHADDFQLITPGGDAWSREEYLTRVESGDLDYRLWEPEGEIQVRLSGDLAAIRYAATLSVVADGQQLSMRAWHTDVYERRDSEWQVVWSQATQRRASDP